MTSIKQRLSRLWGDTREISISLPFGLGGLKITPNKAEQRAAWTLYVELSTRIATQPFDIESGLMREVLNSLYSLFGLTRQVLREAGPEVAHGPDSFGPLAIKILTQGLAPFTTKWHQRLRTYELKCPNDVSGLEHERSWEHFDLMRQELDKLQKEMRAYSVMLARIAGADEGGKN